MNLRHKLILVLSSIGILLLVAIYFVSTSVLLKGFVKIEDEQNQNSVVRFTELLNTELDNLVVSTVSWSSWDEGYQFVLKPNKKFIDTNFFVDSMFDSKFSRVMYFSLLGKTIFSQDYDLLNRKFIPTNKSTLDDFRQNVIMKLKPKELSKPEVGFYKAGNQIEFFSLNPVLTNSGTGDYIGYMVFFRVLDSEAMSKYSRIIKYPIGLEYSADGLDGAKIRKATKFYKTKNKVFAEMSFPDFLNRGQLVFKMPMTRRIFLHGEDTLSRYLGLLLILVCVSSFIVFKVFDVNVVQRILKLNKELVKISEKNSDLSRVEVVGKDELGKLSEGINFTLDSVDQKQVIINRTSKLSALGEVAASIAHEINNPLTIISGYATKVGKLVESPDFDRDEVTKKAIKIKENVIRIEKIIKSLRFLARDGDTDDYVIMEIGKIFEDVETLCQERLKHRGITLITKRFDPTLELRCRPVQIAQVLVNLVNNSIDALEGQSESWIEITSSVMENKIIIGHSDSGPIVSDQVAARMMDPFFTTKISGKGTGLGLSISKNIIESHGGTITLETLPHTRFELSFPRS